MLISRIEVSPKIAFGKPVIKGTRMSVDFILELLSSGWTIEEIISEYPHLKKEDIFACIEYAKELVSRYKVYPFSILESKEKLKKVHEDISR